METKIFTYVLYASLSLSAFYAIYWLLLRKSTHFAFNRAYLILTLCLSMALPLVNIPQLAISLVYGKVSEFEYGFQYRNFPAAIQQPNLEKIPDKTAQTAANSLDLTSILFWIYLAGIAIMLVRFAIMLSSIWKLYRSARPDKCNGAKVAITNKLKAPSSFLNILFIPEFKANNGDIDKIIAHEKVHIRQCHTLDILLVELITTIQWFSPFVWLLKLELRNVHEYLADHGAVNTGIDAGIYQMALLKYSVGEERLALVHTFTNPGIKNRIKMMNKPRSGNFSKWKILSMIPAAFILLTAWANPQSGNQDDQTRTIKGTVYSQGDGFPQYDGKMPVSGADIMIKGFNINTTSEQDGSFELIAPKDAGTLVFFSKEGILSVPITPRDSIVDVALDRNQASLYRKNSGSEWLSSEKLIEQQNPTVIEEPLNAGDSLLPLYIIDGKIIKDSEKGIAGLKPDQIKSIYVLKGRKAIERYGEKAKNGVIIITTQENYDATKERSDGEPIEIRTKPKNPVYIREAGDGRSTFIIDGKEYEGEPYYLAPEEVESMEVIHSPGSLQSTIRIETRKKSLPEQDKEKPSEKIKINEKPQADSLTGQNLKVISPDQPIYIIDGVQVKNLEHLTPDKIDKIDVVRGKEALAAYGDKGRNGVIVITTKRSANK